MRAGQVCTLPIRGLQARSTWAKQMILLAVCCLLVYGNFCGDQRGERSLAA